MLFAHVFVTNHEEQKERGMTLQRGWEALWVGALERLDFFSFFFYQEKKNRSIFTTSSATTIYFSKMLH
ncbi:MAG: hypothetical protein MUC49_06570 [Raineya sp.]|jgi:hypothetical protein|nr:hypothetical protein [Raineya sp.]